MARAIVLVLVLAACGGGDERQSAADYIDEYGGSTSVYSRILASSDCDELQDEFDTAAANNDLADPGTAQHRQTTGYMAAADDRMQAVDCY